MSAPIRPEFEALVPLSAARTKLPEGRSYTRMLEYVRSGVVVRDDCGRIVAKIRLQAIRTPSGWATSRLAWSEFLQEITDAHLRVDAHFDDEQHERLERLGLEDMGEGHEVRALEAPDLS